MDFMLASLLQIFRWKPTPAKTLERSSFDPAENGSLTLRRRVQVFDNPRSATAIRRKKANHALGILITLNSIHFHEYNPSSRATNKEKII